MKAKRFQIQLILSIVLYNRHVYFCRRGYYPSIDPRRMALPRPGHFQAFYPSAISPGQVIRLAHPGPLSVHIGHAQFLTVFYDWSSLCTAQLRHSDHRLGLDALSRRHLGSRVDESSLSACGAYRRLLVHRGPD